MFSDYPTDLLRIVDVHYSFSHSVFHDNPLCHRLSDGHAGSEAAHSARVSEYDKLSDTFIHFVFLGEESVLL